MGLQNTVPILEYRKILMTNHLAMFCLMSAFAMGFFSLLLPFNSQAYVCFAGGSLYSFVFLFNNNGRYRTAGIWFILLSILIVLSLSAVSILEGRPSGAENIFLAVMAVPLLLLDGREKNYGYWIIFLMLVAVKMTRYDYLGLTYNAEFALSILNLLFAAWFLFLILNFFKRILLKAVEKTNVHEKTLYSLLDNVPVFMALVDVNGTYKIANLHYSEMFGVDKNEIIGKRRDKVLPQNILDNHKMYFQRVMEGESVSFLEKNEMPDGRTIISRGKYVPIKDSNGFVESISIYVDDVSELVEAEESLRRANETKDKLFSIIAHDIRSPLNLFQSILNVSDGELISKDEFFGYQKELKGRLESLSGRLDELLDWARMQMGGINAYPSEVDINEVIKGNADLFQTLIKKKNIDFSTKLHCEVDGWMDENHLQVAIRNLLHNALKFTDAGGQVILETSQDDDSVLVEIMDTGAGMTQETVDSILKQEIQKSEIGTSGETGTGLGLSLSLGLLRKNECIVAVDSEPGKGTTFRIWIPKSDINDPVLSD
ncbi:MAG: PAS domain-containing sensor histidine kinase [Cyclobacteriaceae bacterium]